MSLSPNPPPPYTNAAFTPHPTTHPLHFHASLFLNYRVRDGGRVQFRAQLAHGMHAARHEPPHHVLHATCRRQELFELCFLRGRQNGRFGVTTAAAATAAHTEGA